MMYATKAYYLNIFRVPTGQGEIREIWFSSRSGKSGNYVKYSGKIETAAMGYDNEYVDDVSSLSAHIFKEIYL